MFRTNGKSVLCVLSCIVQCGVMAGVLLSSRDAAAQEASSSQKFNSAIVENVREYFEKYTFSQGSSVYLLRHNLLHVSSLNKSHEFLCTEVVGKEVQYNVATNELGPEDEVNGIVARGTVTWSLYGFQRVRLGSAKFAVEHKDEISWDTRSCTLSEISAIDNENWSRWELGRVVMELQFEIAHLTEGEGSVLRYSEPRLTGDLPSHPRFQEFLGQKLAPFERQKGEGWELGIIKSDFKRWPAVAKETDVKLLLNKLPADSDRPAANSRASVKAIDRKGVNPVKP